MCEKMHALQWDKSVKRRKNAKQKNVAATTMRGAAPLTYVRTYIDGNGSNEVSEKTMI